jgi:hypothetical protein
MKLKLTEHILAQLCVPPVWLPVYKQSTGLFRHFSSIKSTAQDPVVLVSRVHFHISYDTKNIGPEKLLAIINVSPHSYQQLQLIDVAFVRPFEANCF